MRREVNNCGSPGPHICGFKGRKARACLLKHLEEVGSSEVSSYSCTDMAGRAPSLLQLK